MNLDDLLDDLAKRVADRVLTELRTPRTHYGSGPKATHPPGKSRAWALRNLKTIPGAKKVGRDWVISIEDYEAWLNERDSKRMSRPAKAAAANDIDAIAEATLAAAGYRLTR